MQEMTEYRVGRNFIRVGHRVKITTTGKWPMEGIVQRLRGDGTTPSEVHVVIARQTVGGRTQQAAGMSRCFTPDRIVRMSQATVKKKVGR